MCINFSVDTRVNEEIIGTAESLGHVFYSGVEGQADFMRAAVRANGGKSIIAMRSTSTDGKRSRIVPFLSETEKKISGTECAVRVMLGKV